MRCASTMTLLTLGLAACATTGGTESSPRASSRAPVTPAGLHLVGHATHYEPWCSGAAPPRGASTRSSPLANADFPVKPGRENAEGEPLMTIHTDAEGRFSVDLPPGTWCIVDAARGPKRPSQSLAVATAPRVAGDPQCADELWKACLAVIDTSQPPQGELQLSMFGHCSWNHPCAPLEPPPP